MKKILIINAYYYPGWRSGGPQQTIMNIVDVFGKHSNIHILTHNHDMGKQTPYSNINYDEWINVGNAKVYYSRKESFSFEFLKKIVKDFDIVYLCGPYCDYSYKVLMLNRIKLIKAKVILAPMGSFSKGALSNKQLKKKIFWYFFKFLGLYKNVIWSFTSEIEKNDAETCVGKSRIFDYYIAEDIPRRYVDLSKKKNIQKEPGDLKIIFLSRICSMKNLLQAIEIVSKLKGNITFDIYGTKEDSDYWNKCETKLLSLNSSTKWNYCGTVKSEDVINVFLQYEVFLFPTMGENYGHVIYESLIAGCIPLISDRTPWNKLEDNECGHAISLENIKEYISCVQKYVDMDKKQISVQCNNAMKYAEYKYQQSIKFSGYKDIFS